MLSCGSCGSLTQGWTEMGPVFPFEDFSDFFFFCAFNIGVDEVK